MNEHILVVEGYDAKLYVERGHLVTRDGFANEGKILVIAPPKEAEAALAAAKR